MTTAEELLAAVKEHATAEDYFEFVCGEVFKVYGRNHVEVDNRYGVWLESVMDSYPRDVREHQTAYSAVQSAFARARWGKA